MAKSYVKMIAAGAAAATLLGGFASQAFADPIDDLIHSGAQPLPPQPAVESGKSTFTDNDLKRAQDAFKKAAEEEAAAKKLDQQIAAAKKQAADAKDFVKHAGLFNTELPEAVKAKQEELKKAQKQAQELQAKQKELLQQAAHNKNGIGYGVMRILNDGDPYKTVAAEGAKTAKKEAPKAEVKGAAAKSEAKTEAAKSTASMKGSEAAATSAAKGSSLAQTGAATGAAISLASVLTVIAAGFAVAKRYFLA